MSSFSEIEVINALRGAKKTAVVELFAALKDALTQPGFPEPAFGGDRFTQEVAIRAIPPNGSVNDVAAVAAQEFLVVLLSREADSFYNARAVAAFEKITSALHNPKTVNKAIEMLGRMSGVGNFVTPVGEPVEIGYAVDGSTPVFTQPEDETTWSQRAINILVATDYDRKADLAVITDCVGQIMENNPQNPALAQQALEVLKEILRAVKKPTVGVFTTINKLLVQYPDLVVDNDSIFEKAMQHASDKTLAAVTDRTCQLFAATDKKYATILVGPDAVLSDLTAKIRAQHLSKFTK